MRIKYCLNEKLFFIFYTDGLLEARRNDTKELLGEERLYQIFDSTYGLDGDASCATILRKVVEFTNDPQFEDDITLLIVDFG